MSGTALGGKHELPKGLSVDGQLCQGVPFTEQGHNGSNNNSSLASLPLNYLFKERFA